MGASVCRWLKGSPVLNLGGGGAQAGLSGLWAWSVQMGLEAAGAENSCQGGHGLTGGRGRGLRRPGLYSRSMGRQEGENQERGCQRRKGKGREGEKEQPV